MTNLAHDPAWAKLPTAPLVTSFGGRVRDRRNALGLSLEALARRMNRAARGAVHFSPATIRSWEAAERVPALATTLFLAQVLNITVAELLGEEPTDRGDRLAEEVQKVLTGYASRRLADLGRPERGGVGA